MTNKIFKKHINLNKFKDNLNTTIFILCKKFIKFKLNLNLKKKIQSLKKKKIITKTIGI